MHFLAEYAIYTVLYIKHKRSIEIPIHKLSTKVDALLTDAELCRHFYMSAQSASIVDKWTMLSTFSSTCTLLLAARTLLVLSL